MTTPLEVLNSYGDAFRELVNARVWGKDEAPEKALKLNSHNDWEFICVAMDVIGDASLAVRHFLQFSLNGATRYDDVGERYLRLYGLLSATYLQQEAALKLYALMNCPKPKTIQMEFNALEIRTLRHQVASHSVGYLPPTGGKAQAFVPVRIGLTGFSCMVTEGRGNSTRTVQLDNAVAEHCRAVIAVLDRIYEKSIKTVFKGQTARIEAFNQKLEALRFVRAGNIILRSDASASQPEIRIVFVDPAGMALQPRRRSVVSPAKRSRSKTKGA